MVVYNTKLNLVYIFQSFLISIYFFHFRNIHANSHFPNTTKNTNQHISALAVYLFCFSKIPDRITLVPLDLIGFNGLMFADEITDFGKLAVCGCARLSGNLVVVSIILSQLNFSVNFSLVKIKYLQFLIMTFPFSFRASYDRGRLICFMTMSFLSQKILLMGRNPNGVLF